MRRAAVALFMFMAAASARADTLVPATGSAPINGGDTAAARERALDEAFRQAVTTELAVIVDEPTRAAGADLIKKRILRKAKAYVTQFKVVSEGSDAGAYHMQIEATIAEATLGAEVRALGIGAPVTPGPTAMPVAPPPVSAARPTLALLVVTADGEAVSATFGRGPAEWGPAAQALGRELEARGFPTETAGGHDIPIASGHDSGSDSLPLDAQQATELARKAGAGGDLCARIEIKDGGPIRGTRDVGAEVTITLRLDDTNSGQLAFEKVSGAGYGKDHAAAVLSAAQAAAGRAGRLLEPRLAAHWPDDSASVAVNGASSGPVVAVAIHGAVRWGDIEPIERALAAMPGVKRVAVGRLSQEEVTLLVHGQIPARTIAEAAQGTPVAETRVAARVVEAGLVDVQLSPEPQPGAVTPSN